MKISKKELGIQLRKGWQKGQEGMYMAGWFILEGQRKLKKMNKQPAKQHSVSWDPDGGRSHESEGRAKAIKGKSH